jgi:Arc/MetJ-type ribon-helix-helix transcriptional regulator
MNRETAGVPTTIVLPVHYRKMLRYLSDKTRVRQSEYVREALQDLLLKYRAEFRRSEYEF